MGKYEEAIALYKKAIQINPDYALVYNNLAVIYYEERQYGLAVKYCDRAVELGYKVHPEFLERLKPYR
jgi:tetratricopeptide (TPR) repeat protein